MQPDKRLITLADNIEQIKKMLDELVLQPRINAIKWSIVTKQTPNIKIGYPGQHLASLITGMEGERTGARGNDLIDGSEVKSCSRIDQLDVCKDCNNPVARLEEECSNCGSTNIDRKNDSKWLFGVRNEADLEVLLHSVKRILLVIGDYPNFSEGDFNTIRFQSFEIWPESERNSRFAEIMTNYYYKIYLAHKKKNPAKTPAPKNFWPYQYQFYMCNPIPTFTCVVHNANTSPNIEIEQYLEPEHDRSKVPSILMPVSILKDNELEIIFKKAKKEELARIIKPAFKTDIAKIKQYTAPQKRETIVGIDEGLRSYLKLRNTDRISVASTQYKRRTR